MRRSAKVDANQAAIVRRLRQLGASVVDLSGVGGGCPDLLVGARGSNVLLEVKNPDGRARRVKSTRDVLRREQRDWHDSWRGPRPVIVYSEDDAIYAVFGVNVKIGGTD